MLFPLFLACVEPGSGDLSGVVTSTRYGATTDHDGYLTVPVEITGAIGAFQVIVSRDHDLLSTEYLYGPKHRLILDWEDWYESSFQLTESFFPSEFATTFNWPVRQEDGPLSAGTYEVVISTLTPDGSYASNAPVQVEVLTRPEPIGKRVLRVVVAYADGVRDEGGVVEAVEAAVAHWVDLYAAVGVDLQAEYDDIAVDSRLPEPNSGLAQIADFQDGRSERSVLMLVGESIAGDSLLFGEAGSLPGPYAAVDHGAVFVSWLAHAGADARFQAEDILLFGETMAHEVGHYLGLYHPVEGGFEYWDALADTDNCGATSACERTLGSNLMFPYPVCSGGRAGSCQRQDRLTSGQTGVLRGWVGVE